MLFNNILVPYDGSVLADDSLNKALDFAKLDLSIHITVLHVAEIAPKTIHTSDAVYNQYRQAVLNEANEFSKLIHKKLADSKNHIEVFVKVGKPAYEILQFVKEQQCDLIIMGSRGLRGIKEYLGSVSHTITQQSPIPVLLMK
jgi:nucleotide-binding universal stress UspA family protein